MFNQHSMISKSCFPYGRFSHRTNTSSLLMPVKMLISPALVFAYNPFTSRLLTYFKICANEGLREVDLGTFSDEIAVFLVWAYECAQDY
jgi:hypothetical protein